MKEIDKVFITGTAGAEALGGLLSKAGLKSTADLGDASLLIECLTGGIEARKEVLRKWDGSASPDAVLATTSTWGVTEIAAGARKPERVVGLSFIFNPVESKSLVQIVKGLETSAETVGRCQELAKKVGAMSIVVEDSPGLVLDRVMAAVINEAAGMYATGVATKEDIDRITRLCLNWPLGPFEFADTIGLDNVLATLEVLSQRESARFVPHRLLREMVAMGKLGKKTGKGFYAY